MILLNINSKSMSAFQWLILSQLYLLLLLSVSTEIHVGINLKWWLSLYGPSSCSSLLMCFVCLCTNVYIWVSDLNSIKHHNWNLLDTIFFLVILAPLWCVGWHTVMHCLLLYSSQELLSTHSERKTAILLSFQCMSFKLHVMGWQIDISCITHQGEKWEDRTQMQTHGQNSLMVSFIKSCNKAIIKTQTYKEGKGKQAASK